MNKVVKSFLKDNTRKKDMDWAQAKWNYPKLRNMGDWDKDGVKNQFDCKPFDKKRQHDSKWKSKMIEDFATIGDLKKFAEDKRKSQE